MIVRDSQAGGLRSRPTMTVVGPSYSPAQRVAVAHGLTKEQALQAITLSAAKILGVDDRAGSLEVGKDANIVVSAGDILDIRTSIIEHAFIQGREVNLENKQTQLYHRYMTKYGLTEAPIP